MYCRHMGPLRASMTSILLKMAKIGSPDWMRSMWHGIHRVAFTCYSITKWWRMDTNPILMSNCHVCRRITNMLQKNGHEWATNCCARLGLEVIWQSKSTAAHIRGSGCIQCGLRRNTYSPWSHCGTFLTQLQHPMLFQLSFMMILW